MPWGTASSQHLGALDVPSNTPYNYLDFSKFKPDSYRSHCVISRHEEQRYFYNRGSVNDDSNFLIYRLRLRQGVREFNQLKSAEILLAIAPKDLI